MGSLEVPLRDLWRREKWRVAVPWAPALRWGERGTVMGEAGNGASFLLSSSVQQWWKSWWMGCFSHSVEICMCACIPGHVCISELGVSDSSGV